MFLADLPVAIIGRFDPVLSSLTPNSPLKAVVSDKDVKFLARAQPNQMARMRPNPKS